MKYYRIMRSRQNTTYTIIKKTNAFIPFFRQETRKQKTGKYSIRPNIITTKVSFSFWDQSQDMSLSGFPPKTGI